MNPPHHGLLLASLALMSVLAFTLTLQREAVHTVAGSPSQQQEHEAIAYRGVTACGVERWSIKTGTDGDARSINTRAVVPTSIYHLRGLPAQSNLPLHSRIRPTETTVFSIDATLMRIKMESDSDYHLILSDSGGRTMIAEIPAPQCVGSSSPFLPSLRYVRRKVDSLYHPGSSWLRPNVHVHITGVGFFDFLHGQSGVAPNAIELHPVLAIQFGKGGGSPSPVPPAPAPPSGSTGTFPLIAWVSPSSMPYGAYPTLYGKTAPGAVCTASVLYSTGRHPRSFDGSSRTAGSNGTVSWSWHEETKGSGGEGDVSCSYRGQTKSATASFTVTG